MRRILLSLIAAAAVLTFSTGAFAQSPWGRGGYGPGVGGHSHHSHHGHGIPGGGFGPSVHGGHGHSSFYGSGFGYYGNSYFPQSSFRPALPGCSTPSPVYRPVVPTYPTYPGYSTRPGLHGSIFFGF